MIKSILVATDASPAANRALAGRWIQRDHPVERVTLIERHVFGLIACLRVGQRAVPSSADLRDEVAHPRAEPPLPVAEIAEVAEVAEKTFSIFALRAKVEKLFPQRPQRSQRENS